MDLNEALQQAMKLGISANVDKDDEIPALKGKYEAEIASVKRFGTEEQGMYSINFKITKTISGVSGEKRYIQKKLNYGKPAFENQDEVKIMQDLLKNLVTLGILGETETFPSYESLGKKIEGAIGKTAYLKLEPLKREGKIARDDSGWPKHKVTLVKEFNDVPASDESKLPF